MNNTQACKPRGDRLAPTATNNNKSRHAGVVPALMVAYSEADAVEGLDVDKYHFDKFSMRHTVDTVLRELWKDERCLLDLMAMAAPDHPQCAALFHWGPLWSC